jgi:cytoskeleton protein RodZ
MAARRKRKLSFLPQPPAVDPAIGYGSFPLEIGVGELLRMTREHQGQELQSVANQLRIRLAYLQAIEDGRFRDLPGSTYAVGFVRSYADYLGLDGGDVVRRFREEAAKVHGRPKLVFPVVSAEGKIPGAAVLLLSAVGAAIVYGAWYYLSSSEDRDLQLIAEVPDRLVALPPGESGANEPLTVPAPTGGESGGAASAAPPASSPVDHGSTTTAQASEAIDVSPPSEEGAVAPDPDTSIPASPPAADPAAGAAPPTVGAQAQPAAEPPQAALATVPGTGPTAPASEPTDTAPADAAAAGAIPAAPPAPADTPAAPQQAALPPGDEKGIVLQARLDSWIQILDGKGQTVIDRILRAGERYVVPAGSGLVLTTGNAGGLDMFLDGQHMPPLGDVGAVRRRISLDPGQLRQGTATE